MAGSQRGIVIQITGDGASAARALELVDQHLRETGTVGKESGSAIAAGMDQIKTALQFLVLGEGVAKIKEMVSASIELADSMAKLSEKTGISTGTLSVLGLAAKEADTNQEVLNKGLVKLAKSMQDASDGVAKPKKAFADLGISMEDLRSKDPGQIFALIAQKLRGIESPALRAQAVIALFGKSGAELIPVMNQIAEEGFGTLEEKAKRFGIYVGGDLAEQMKSAQGTLADLSAAGQGAALEFTTGIMPAIVGTAQALGGLIGQGDGFRNFGTEMGQQVLLLAADFSYMLKFVQQARAEYMELEALAGMAEEGPNTKFNWTAGMKAEAQAKYDGFKQELQDAKDLHKEADEEYEQFQQTLSQMASTLGASSGTMEGGIKKKGSGGAATGDDTAAKEAAAKKWASLQAEARSALLHSSIEDARRDRELEEKIHDALAKTWEGFQKEDAEGADKPLANARLAAQIEEQTNSGIEARLALMRQENDLELKKIEIAQGTSSEAYLERQHLEQVLEAKLRIGDVERQIRETEAANTAGVSVQRDREQKDPTQRKAATQAINQLNEQTAATLKGLVAQYDALAAALGGEFIEKARELHAELDKLSTPDKKGGLNAELGKTLGQGMESMAQQMASATGRGRESFHAMVMSIEQDIVQLAVKLSFEKWLTPLLVSAAGGSGGMVNGVDISGIAGGLSGHATGGDMDGPGIVGEEGPEIFFPKGPGTVMPNDVMQGLAGRGSQAPNVTMNLTNASSQPVTARTTSTSFDSDSKSWMVHTILEDMSQGGPISEAMKGMAQPS